MKEPKKNARHQRHFEELFNLCSDYDKELEKVDFEQADSDIAAVADQDVMIHNQQFHQFGAISFYTHHSSQWSPANTLQHKR